MNTYQHLQFRTPGFYKEVDPFTGRTTSRALEQTNEYIHASVRTRYKLDGPGVAMSASPELGGVGRPPGAFRFAIEEGCMDAAEDWFLALNGDSVVLCELQSLLQHAGRDDIDGAIVGLPVADTSRFGSLEVDAAGVLKGFREKQPGSGLINGGIYLMRRSRLEAFRSPGAVSMETDILPGLLAAGKRILVIDAGKAPFIDIGTPETLAAADRFVADHRPMFGG